MTDISHGYEDLGLLLKDKITELNTKLSKLQKAQEESSSMMQWLQKMNKTAKKWHHTPTPTDTEAVKTQVEQNKVYYSEDMEESGFMFGTEPWWSGALLCFLALKFNSFARCAFP